MAKISAFYETKLMFCSAIQYEGPLNFEQWNNIPDDNKAVHLFVQFYDTILQAWHKVNKFDTVTSESGVEEMMQYLMKNVPLIVADPARFTPSYIYRVAFNCLDCLVYYHSKPAENEISENYDYDGDELNLIDTTVDTHSSLESTYESIVFDQKFWAAIEDEGIKAQKILHYLLSGDKQDLKKLTRRNKYYNIDPLRDVVVAEDEVEEILESIRVRLESIEGLKEHYNIG